MKDNDINKTFLQGRISRFENRQAGGHTVTKFNLESVMISKNDKEIKTWMDVEVWNSQKAQTLGDGDCVFVGGSLKTNSFTNSDGKKVWKNLINATEISIIFQLAHTVNGEEDIKAGGYEEGVENDVPY